MYFRRDFAVPALRLHDPGQGDKVAACFRAQRSAMRPQGLRPSPVASPDVGPPGPLFQVTR
jgi:hypothetical protein